MRYSQKLKKIPLLILGLILTLLILILRPFKHIRLIPYGAENFGKNWQHISIYLNLMEKDKELFRKKKDIIFFDSINVSNNFLKLKIKKLIKIYEYSNILFYTFKICKIFGLKDHFLLLPSTYELWKRFYKKENYTDFLGWPFKIYIHLTNNENLKGIEILEKFGMAKDSKWICIHNRDSAFKNEISKSGEIEKNHLHRNFSAKSLIAAAKVFSKNGYYVLRMGSHSNELFNIKDSKIIDYVNSSNKSSFADLFFLTNCEAYFGSDSGVAAPTIGSKKYISHINFSPLDLHTLTWHKCILFIFKRIKKRKSLTNLSLKEIFEKKIYGETSYERLNSQDYEMTNNTEEEIEDVAKELCFFLKRKTSMSELQKKFNNDVKNLFKIYKKENLLGPNPIIVSENFIKKNIDYIN